MACFAAQAAAARPRYVYDGLLTHVLLVVCSLPLVTTVLTVALVLGNVHPVWTPQYLIPLLGMALGNTINAIALGMDDMLTELKEGRDRVEVLLSLGASRWEATHEAMAKALGLALMPTINGLAVIGLVSIPGMMTGKFFHDSVLWRQPRQAWGPCPGPTTAVRGGSPGAALMSISKSTICQSMDDGLFIFGPSMTKFIHMRLLSSSTYLHFLHGQVSDAFSSFVSFPDFHFCRPNTRRQFPAGCSKVSIRRIDDDRRVELFFRGMQRCPDHPTCRRRRRLRAGGRHSTERRGTKLSLGRRRQGRAARQGRGQLLLPLLLPCHV